MNGFSEHTSGKLIVQRNGICQEVDREEFDIAVAWFKQYMPDWKTIVEDEHQRTVLCR